MYAIVKIAGEQIKVAPGTRCATSKLPYDVGEEIVLEEVLLIEDGDTVLIGQPVLKGWKVVAEIIQHDKDPKVIVFKKKRRKGYRSKRGHRQLRTDLLVKTISKH